MTVLFNWKTRIYSKYRESGQRGLLGQGLRGGGPGRPPFWRKMEESRKGLCSVILKINNQHTVPITNSGAHQNIYKKPNHLPSTPPPHCYYLTIKKKRDAGEQEKLKRRKKDCWHASPYKVCASSTLTRAASCRAPESHLSPSAHSAAP